ISEYVRKPRSLPSLIRFLRRVRRVSASSFGVSAGSSHSSLRPRRPPRPPLPFALTSLTFASSSSSACLALLIGVFALALLSSGFGASAFTASVAFGAAALCARAGSLARSRSRFLTARDFAAETRFSVLVLRTFLAFFLAARTFLTFDLRFFWTILTPQNDVKPYMLAGSPFFNP